MGPFEGSNAFNSEFSGMLKVFKKFVTANVLHAVRNLRLQFLAMRKENNFTLFLYVAFTSLSLKIAIKC